MKANDHYIERAIGEFIVHINKYLDHDLFNIDQFADRPNSLYMTRIGYARGFTWLFTCLGYTITLSSHRGAIDRKHSKVQYNEWKYIGSCDTFSREVILRRGPSSPILLTSPKWSNNIDRLDALKEELRLEKRAKSLTGVLSI